ERQYSLDASFESGTACKVPADWSSPRDRRQPRSVLCGQSPSSECAFPRVHKLCTTVRPETRSCAQRPTELSRRFEVSVMRLASVLGGAGCIFRLWIRVPCTQAVRTELGMT